MFRDAEPVGRLVYFSHILLDTCMIICMSTSKHILSTPPLRQKSDIFV